MGRSSFTSDIYGNIKITVASVNATNVKGLTKAQAPKVHASSYVEIGTDQFIFVTSSNTEASIVAEATALAGDTVKGSLSIASGSGLMWLHYSDTAAARVYVGGQSSSSSSSSDSSSSSSSSDSSSSSSSSDSSSSSSSSESSSSSS